MVQTTKDGAAIPRGRKKHRSRWRKQASRHTQYLALRVGHAVFSRLPLGLGRAIAWLVGTAAYWSLRRERLIAISNLEHAFPELTPGEVRRRARDSFRHVATTYIEWVILRRWTREKLLRRFPAIEDELEKLHSVAGHKKIVLIAAHLGNWEVFSFLYGLFKPGASISAAKPTKFAKTRAFLHELRTARGFEVFYTDETPRKLMRALKDQRIVGFLPDQDLRTNAGVFVEFFGRPTHTVTFPAALARRARAEMVFCVMVRENGRFRMLVSDLFAVPVTDDEDDDVLQATQRWTQELEGNIRRYPGQWLWFYPRWRTSPEQPRRHKKGRAL